MDVAGRGRAVTGEGADRSSSFAERLRLMETVVTHTQEAVVVTEVEGDEPRIVFVNDAFCRQSGFSRDEVEGQHPRVLVGPETDLSAQVALREAVISRTPVTVDILHYRHDGSSYWVENSLTPVANDAGVATHVISLQRDITARKAAEASRTERYEVLKRMAAGDPMAGSLKGLMRMADGPGQASAILTVEGGRLRPTTPPPAAVREMFETWPVVDGPDPCTLAAVHGRREVVQRADGSYIWAYPLLGSEGPLGVLAVLGADHEPDDGRDAELAELAALATLAVEAERGLTRLGHEATHDRVTGLPNRALVADRLTVALRRTASQQTAVAVIVISLSGDPRLMEVGRTTLDGVWTDIAGRLVALVAPGDSVGRHSGDEMIIIAEPGDEHSLAALCLQLGSAVTEAFAAVGVKVVPRLGATLTDRPAETTPALIRAAEAAAQRAHQEGPGSPVIDDRRRAGK